MSFGFVASQMIVVSLPILLGWIARRRGTMTDAFDAQLSRIVLNIGLPCMILASLRSSGGQLDAATMLWALAGETLLLLIALAIGCLVTAIMRTPASAVGVYRFTVMFSNCGLIGFPIISAVLGPEALLVAAIGLIPANILVFTVGVMMFKRSDGTGWRHQLRSLAACCTSPTLLASVTVCICVLLGIHGFGLLSSSLSLAGQITTPAALLLTGSALAKYDAREMLGNWRAYVAACARLLLAPIAGMMVLRLLPIEPAVLAILVLEAAMPAGTNGILYCLEYGVDAKPMAQSMFLSIVGAILSIPIITVLLTG